MVLVYQGALGFLAGAVGRDWDDEGSIELQCLHLTASALISSAQKGHFLMPEISFALAIWDPVRFEAEKQYVIVSVKWSAKVGGLFLSDDFSFKFSHSIWLKIYPFIFDIYFMRHSNSWGGKTDNSTKESEGIGLYGKHRINREPR